MTINEMYPNMKRKFTPVELERLASLELSLQQIVIEVNHILAIFIVCGHRNEIDQNKAVASGASKVKWPNGKHNTIPSKAVDTAPMIDGVIPWNNAKTVKQFAYMAGIIAGVAASLGIKIRQGVDFNMNGDITDDKFNDMPHTELVG